jgi:hypothetical protein
MLMIAPPLLSACSFLLQRLIGYVNIPHKVAWAGASLWDYSLRK